MHRAFLLLVASSSALLSGCALDSLADTDAAPGRGARVLVGTVEDSDAVVGMSLEGEALTFYLCGGKSDFATHTHWFATSVGADGEIAAETPDGFSLQGEIADGVAHGTVSTPDGTELAWSADYVGISSIGGLYDARDSGCRTGVVVLPGAGTAAPTIHGVWCDAQGRAAQVTPILPLRAAGFRVRAMTPIGARNLLALPVEPD